MPKSKRKMQGAVVSRLLLDLLQSAKEGMLRGGLKEASYTDVAILCAVLIGQAERRTMTAGKAAAYLDLPRATVTRRLQDMAAQGLCRQDANKGWRIATEDDDHAALVDSVIVTDLQHIQKAMAKLSILDT
jgi:CRP-like cAMP-binding protein